MDISSLRERDFKTTLTVTELNGYIKNLFDSNRTLVSVNISGEISNFVEHRSGHLYFSLKDNESQIKAVMFKSQRMKLRFRPESGMKVVAHGSVSLYPGTGSIQIYVNSLEPDGIGALYLAYEQLKEKLKSEGLFDDGHKKLIPLFPEKIGVITSPTGAAVRDIINVTGRRYPLAKIYLYPSLVQGEGAEENLIRALDYFDASSLVDVIIIGRGGGSIEDLWAFNSEKLARRIYDSKTPIISAVGHETDFTICDFVSDMRAPTPSAAAELSVPDLRDIILRLDTMSDRLSSALLHLVRNKREKLDNLTQNQIFVDSKIIFEEKKNAVSTLLEDITARIDTNVEKTKTEMRVLLEKLQALNPLSVLERGYAVIENLYGTIRSSSDIAIDDKIKIIIKDGVITAKVTEVSEGK